MARSVACSRGIPVEVSSVHLFPCFGQALVSQYIIDRCPDQRSILKTFVEQYGRVECFEWPRKKNGNVEIFTSTDPVPPPGPSPTVDSASVVAELFKALKDEEMEVSSDTSSDTATDDGDVCTIQ